jgi:MFS family permease
VAEQDRSKGAWSLLSLLMTLNILNFVDRQLLQSFANFIVPDLGLTNTQFGLLTGLYFLIFYAVAGLFTGALADVMHRPRLIAGAAGLWSALTAASGAATSFISLAIPRALIGVGESALTPTALSLLSDRFKAAQLSLAVGIYYMGVPLGAGASLLVAGFLGPAIGWRNCFFLLGAIGLGMALLVLTVRETRPKRPQGARIDFGKLVAELVGALQRSPALVATICGGVALHWAIGAAAFDQLWFVQERGFERAEIARLNGLVIVASGVAGNLFGGWLGDWWLRTTGQGRPMLLFWMILLMSPLGFMFRLIDPETPLFWIGMAAATFQFTAFYGPTFSTVQELAPQQARGTVTAFYILCLNVIGLGVSITLTGVLVDHLKAAGETQPYTVAMVAFGAISLLAAPAFLLAGRWFGRDMARIAGA